jgi:hypothetical protein
MWEDTQFDYSLNHVRLDKITLAKDLDIWMSDDLASSFFACFESCQQGKSDPGIDSPIIHLLRLLTDELTLYSTCKTSSRIWKCGVAALSEERSKSVGGSAAQGHQNGARLSRTSI